MEGEKMRRTIIALFIILGIWCFYSITTYACDAYELTETGDTETGVFYSICDVYEEQDYIVFNNDAEIYRTICIEYSAQVVPMSIFHYRTNVGSNVYEGNLSLVRYTYENQKTIATYSGILYLVG